MAGIDIITAVCILCAPLRGLNCLFNHPFTNHETASVENVEVLMAIRFENAESLGAGIRPNPFP